MLKPYSLCILAAAFCSLCNQAAASELVGQGNDGNRATPVHRIELYSDDGIRIRSNDQDPKPFSTRQTCGRCHEYTLISGGWHFNAHNSEVESGRPGQPWVLTDLNARTQVPVTGRQWPGTFTPEQLDITPWEMVAMNFSHFPGGGYGEIKAKDPYEADRQAISGMYEINCLACHNADSRQDQDQAALQAARGNYRWIPAVASGLADIRGVASDLTIFDDPDAEDGITFSYNDNLFDEKGLVFLDVTGQPKNERCYFCHSNQNLAIDQENEWTRDEDVHLNSGLACVDCHRNGDDHMISRGTAQHAHGETLTCEGCHIGPEQADVPQRGRLGAPKPTHRGIPTIHFESLTCTACHSGPWPGDEATRWRTARIHRTGLHGRYNLEIRRPHVYAPVMMKGADGKIGPYKVMWPAYWARIEDGTPVPVAPKTLPDAAMAILNTFVETEDDWKPLTAEQILDVLKVLESGGQKAAYIAGGQMYQLSGEGTLDISDDPAAAPYAWPLAHDVRPAEQALGVRQCKDCHTTDSPFFFGTVERDTPIKTEAGPEFIEAIELQGINRLYMWAFNASFMFRPMMKIIAFISCGVIGLVLLAYLLKAVVTISRHSADEEVFKCSD